MSSFANIEPHRILITGGCGFIGSNLIEHLVTQDSISILNIDKLGYASSSSSWAKATNNAKYRFVNADIRDADTIDETLASFCPHTVLHLAAETHVDRSIDGPSAFIQSNVVGTATLLESATKYLERVTSIQRSDFRFIYTSTDEVFGSIPDGMKAADNHRFSPSSPYAASKASGDCLVESWQRTFDLPCTTIRFSNVYGPFQFPEKLIPVSIIRALLSEPLALYGEGDQQRDWLHVDDAVQGIARVLSSGSSGAVYQFATGILVKNRDLLRSLCKALDTQLAKVQPPISAISSSLNSFDLVKRVEDRPGHDARYAMDTCTTSKELNWQAAIGLEKGLAQTVRWYLNNRSWWEPILATQYNLKRLGSPRSLTSDSAQVNQ